MAVDPRDLCTVAEVETVHRTVGPTDAYRALIQQMVTAASVAIMTWSGRRFAPPADDAEPETRLYEAGSLVYGELMVDDLAAEPESVERLAGGDGTPVAITGVRALPLYREADTPVTRLRLPLGTALDRGDLIAVTGAWGFPAVPPDVRMACVDVVDAWLTAAQAGAGPSPEAIEAGALAMAPSRAMTPRARGLLYPYRRIVLV